MKLIDDLTKRLEGKNLSEVARRASVARDHVTHIAHGRAKDMKIGTYEKINAVLEEIESKRGWTTCEAVQHSDQVVCETCGVAWDAGDPDGPIDLCGKMERDHAAT